MRSWPAERVAQAAGAQLLRAPADPGGPERAAVDSREVHGGELFFGLPGTRVDGGAHGAAALAAGAWGVLVSEEHAEASLAAAELYGGAVLAHPDPLGALQALARAWRRELGGRGALVIGITGSSGKTSTKDILAALLAKAGPTAATPANLNTEVGLPLAILAAPSRTRFLVLEMAMRGRGQIAELTAIAEPDVGVIVNIGKAHLELLGSVKAIAAAKSELTAGLRAGAVAVLPAREPLLEPHRRPDLRTITFGEGGDVQMLERRGEGTVVIDDAGVRVELRPNFAQAHNLMNLLAAVGAAGAVGVRPAGELRVSFSAMRGQRRELPGGIVVIDDCYNANPMSMRAAIEDLAASARGRRVAVLGDMLELGPQAPELHRELGALAAGSGVGVLVAVGDHAADLAAGYGAAGALQAGDAAQAAALVGGVVREGDTVLVKGSRGVGLERVVAALAGGKSGRG